MLLHVPLVPDQPAAIELEALVGACASPEGRALLDEAISRIGKGVTHLLGPLDGLKGAMAMGAPTGRFLAAPMTHPLQLRRPVDDTLPQLLVRGAALHSLEGLDVAVPLHPLVDGGHSVLVIEHDLDVIAEADWIVHLGPEGGAHGGRVVAAPSPEALAANPASHTGPALVPVLHRGRPAAT